MERWLYTIPLRMRSLFRRARVEQELDEEIRLHLERKIQEAIENGMTPEEARRAALVAMGGIELCKEECRDTRRTAWIETGIRNLRYSFRTLRKSPGFALAALLVLGLGIGANSTIFTIVNSLLLSPLPVNTPQQLVSLNRGAAASMSYPDYVDFRDRNDVLSGLAAHRYIPMNISIGAGNNARLWGYEVTGNYFDLLGVRPVLGRLLRPEDDEKPGAHPVLVLSHQCWRNRFASDPNIAGKTVKINGLNYTILGVTPAAFYGTERILRPEVWVPMSMQAQIEPGSNWLNRRDTTNVWVLGRLRHTVTRQQAEASLNRIAAQLAQEHPATHEGMKIELSAPGLLGKALRGPVLGFVGALMAVAGLVLLLACTNLAAMLLARASDRRKEMAVRLALGARPARLLLELLTENSLLAIGGGILGFLLSIGLAEAFRSWQPPFDISFNTSLAVDARVLVFTLFVSLLATFLFGFAPALQAAKADLTPALKGGIIAERFRRWHLRDLLVTLQIALCIVLLIASVLVVRSLQHAVSLNPGFDPDHAVSISLDLGLQGYDEQHGRAFQQRMLDSVSALPGVTAAGIINNVPLRMGTNTSGVSIVGRPLPPASKMPVAFVYDISPGYLRAAGTRLLAGRDMDSRDRARSPRVALVNETFVRMLLPGGNPIGKQFRFGRTMEADPIEIAGVVEGGKYQSLGEDSSAAVFLPLAQSYNSWTTLVVRTPLPPQEAINAMRRVITQMDPTIALFNVGSLKDQLALPLFPARVAAMLLGTFGLLGMVLAATGVFASVAYAVSRRTREFGIRMALGAHAGQVLAIVLRRTATLWLAGAVIGTVIALGAVQILSAVLYGVSPRDPVAYATALALMAAVALLACWYPAQRAVRIHPARTLRAE
jgi:predicted permease